MSTYDRPVKGMAGAMFAAIMMVTLGVFQAIEGLVAMFNDDWYVKTAHYTFDLNVTAYGWIHLIIGILMVDRRLGAVLGPAVGRPDHDVPVFPQRDRQLLLHPLLPVLVDPHHRPEHLGHLVAHAARRDQGLSTRTEEGRRTMSGERRAGGGADTTPRRSSALLKCRRRSHPHASIASHLLGLMAAAFAITAWLLSGMDDLGRLRLVPLDRSVVRRRQRDHRHLPADHHVALDHPDARPLLPSSSTPSCSTSSMPSRTT